MASLAPEVPANPPRGFASDIAGMWNFLIDPEGAAQHVHSKWFWVGPLIVFAFASAMASYLLMPIVQHVLSIAPLPEGTTPEQYQKGVAFSLLLGRILMWLAPVTACIIYAVQAVILLGGSMAMGVKARFGQLFNLVAGASLIQVVAAIASVIIVRAKGDISTVAELRPALGLDIFLPEGTNKFLTAFVGYFSVFEVWWIIMLALIFAAAFRVKKTRAFAVIAPLVLLSVLFKVGAAVFQH